jgi:hypothetical protein
MAKLQPLRATLPRPKNQFWRMREHSLLPYRSLKHSFGKCQSALGSGRHWSFVLYPAA